MTNGQRHRHDASELDANPQREFWYSVLTLFPFGFIPIVTVIAVLAALIMPYVTGVSSR